MLLPHSRAVKDVLWEERTSALTAIANPNDFKNFMRSFDNYDQIYQLVGANASNSQADTRSGLVPLSCLVIRCCLMRVDYPALQHSA